MSKQSKENEILGNKALEMVMRDVLCGMEDLAAMLGYREHPGDFEIIAIEPAEPGASTPQVPASAEPAPSTKAVVLPFPAANDPRMRTRRSRVS